MFFLHYLFIYLCPQLVSWVVIYFSMFSCFSCENNLLSCSLFLFSLHTRSTVCLCVFVCLPGCLSSSLSVCEMFLFIHCNIHLNIFIFNNFVCLFLVCPCDTFVRSFLESLIHTFQCEKPRNPSRSCKPFGFHGRLYHVQWASKKGNLYFALFFALIGQPPLLYYSKTNSLVHDKFSVELKQQPERWSCWYTLDQCSDLIGFTN